MTQKMHSSLRLFYYLALVAGALAAKPLQHEVCAASCYYSLAKIKYSGGNETERTACTNSLRVTSTYYCMGIHCEEADVKPGIDWWSETCKKSKQLVNVEAYRTAMSHITADELARLRTVNLTEKYIVNGTAVPSDSAWLLVHRSLAAYDANRSYSNKIRWIPYGLWALVLLGGIGNRALNSLSRHRSSQKFGTRRYGLGKGTRWPTGFQKLRSWTNVHLVMAPTFSHHHHQPWGWLTIPLRLQSIVLVLYATIHITLLAVNYHIYDENYYYVNNTRRTQVLRYLGDRLGTLMSSTLPLLFLFGGRSNILVALTGWNYRTFNIFHRWIARILLLEAVVHGVIFSAFDINDKGWDQYHDNLRHDEIYRYGLMMAVTLGLSVATAHSQVRKHMYEFFKTTHVILAGVFLAAYYEHIESQFRGTYKVFAWVCIGIWCADRVSRILRILFINYKSFIGKGSPALASFSEETGMIRLQVYPSITSVLQAPGSYYYLSFPGWRFWEAHPFSLAGWSAQEIETPTPFHTEEKGGAAVARRTVCAPEPDKPYLTFLIRPRNGMTGRLRDTLQRQGGQRRLQVLLEGPYGTPAQLAGFNDILFLAGGSGITAVMPYIRTLLEGKDDLTNIPNITLAWTVRSEDLVRDVLANELRRAASSALAASRLRMQFFITGSRVESGSTTPTTPGLVTDIDTEFEDSRFKRSRLDVDSVVDGFIQAEGRRQAIFVCGPEKMVDTARAAVIRHAKNGSGDVEFFEELYGW
ncbi:hypothetical protein VTK56DRAFT_8314 [Thermocarpiscus australiensis]